MKAFLAGVKIEPPAYAGARGHGAEEREARERRSGRAGSGGARGRRAEEREANETTDLKTGATETTEGTDPGSADSEFDAAPAERPAGRIGQSLGRAEGRFLTAIERAPQGGASLLDTILGDVQREMAGQVQPDDLTLLTATVLRATSC
jgi:hypothetical protein